MAFHIETPELFKLAPLLFADLSFTKFWPKAAFFDLPTMLRSKRGGARFNSEMGNGSRLNRTTGQVGKWASGQVGKWASGQVGKWAKPQKLFPEGGAFFNKSRDQFRCANFSKVRMVAKAGRAQPALILEGHRRCPTTRNK